MNQKLAGSFKYVLMYSFIHKAMIHHWAQNMTRIFSLEWGTVKPSNKNEEQSPIVSGMEETQTLEISINGGTQKRLVYNVYNGQSF